MLMNIVSHFANAIGESQTELLEMVGIQRNTTKIKSGPLSPIIIWPSKFELNLVSGLYGNAWKLLDQSQARKYWEFSRW